MRKLVLVSLLAGGCFDFDRILSGPAPDLSVGRGDAAMPDLRTASCTGLANHTWYIASSTSLDDFTSVVSDSRLPPSTVWAVTSAAEVLQLHVGSVANTFNAASLFSFNTVSRLALDPMDGVVLAAADSNGDLQPLLMSMTGTLTTTERLPEKTTWAGVAATKAAGISPGAILAATYMSPAPAGSSQDHLDSFPRPKGPQTSVTLENQSPRHVATTPAGVVVCGTNGLFATWTGSGWSMTPIESATNDCVYLASAPLPSGYRLAYVDGPSGDVCISDDGLANVTCNATQPDAFAVAIAPCDPDTLVALSPHTVSISTDAGKNWAAMGMGNASLTTTDLTITDEGVLYVAGKGGTYAFYE